MSQLRPNLPPHRQPGTPAQRLQPPAPSSHPIRSTAELAAHLGLSRSTISRALNGQPGLKPKTLRTIRDAMDAMDFTPNAHAVRLKGQQTDLVGVCLEDLLTPTAVAKVSGLQQHLRAKGITTLIEVVPPKATRKTLRHFLSLRVGAVAYVGHFDPTELGQRIDDLLRHGTPHLVIDNPGIARANTLSLNRASAMAQVTAQLIGAGHRTFGLLGISGPFQTVTDRLEGIHRALRHAGLDPAAAHSLDHLHERTDHFEYGRTLAHSFLRQRKRPSAFIAVNDETAVGALLAFQEAGLRVPEDAAVIGFNNQNICLMSRPQLSSVDQQIETTMKTAAGMIVRLLREPPKAPVARQVEGLIVTRGSTLAGSHRE